MRVDVFGIRTRHAVPLCSQTLTALRDTLLPIIDLWGNPGGGCKKTDPENPRF